MRGTFALALAAVSSLVSAQMLIGKIEENLDMDQSLNIVDMPQQNEATSGPSDDDDDIITINLSSVNREFKSTLEQTGIPLKAGGQIRFQVRGNPTTGYQWQELCCNSHGAFSVEKSFKRDPAPEGYTGVGGTYYFTITANKPSEGEDSIFSHSIFEDVSNIRKAAAWEYFHLNRAEYLAQCQFPNCAKTYFVKNGMRELTNHLRTRHNIDLRKNYKN